MPNFIYDDLYTSTDLHTGLLTTSHQEWWKKKVAQQESLPLHEASDSADQTRF